MFILVRIVKSNSFVILGKAPLGKRDGELPLEIGMNSIIRSFTTIYAGNKIGNNFATGQNVFQRKNIIADNAVIGSSLMLEVEYYRKWN